MTMLHDDLPPLAPGDEQPIDDAALAQDGAALLRKVLPGCAVLDARVTLNRRHGPVWRADYRRGGPPDSVTIWRFVYWRRPADEIGVATATAEDAGPLLGAPVAA